MPDAPLQYDAVDAFDRPIKIDMYPSDEDPTYVVVNAHSPSYKIKVTPRAELDEYQDTLNIAAEIARRRQGL